MTLLHLGMVVYDLICVILMFLGVLCEEKEFRANWRKIEPSHKEPEHVASWRPDVRIYATHPSYCLPASGRQNLRNTPKLLSPGVRLASRHQTRVKSASLGVLKGFLGETYKGKPITHF